MSILTQSNSVSPSVSLAEGSDEMHRSYQSILPCQNKLLQKRWDKTYYDEHRRKVANVTPMVDTKAPQTYVHLHLKLKKLQLEEDRLDVIERDNRILLEKMAYIMRTKGRVDNYHGYTNKSLNAEKREREQLRISVENKNILRRILSRQPVYSHRAWLEDWKRNRALSNNISHFPNEWWKTAKSNNNHKETPRRSTRKIRKKGAGSVRSSQKDEDEYSQNYETEDEEESAVKGVPTERSEVVSEEKPKTGGGGGEEEKKKKKKEEEEETEGKDKAKDAGKDEQTEPSEDKEEKPKENGTESPENPETGAAQS